MTVFNPTKITHSSGPSIYTYSLSYNSSLFPSDPTGCLTYADDCEGFSPISSLPSSLGPVGNVGSWGMNSDGTSSNKILNDCFYATFTSNGVLHEKLNPNNLTKKIATWNNSTKKWESASGSSSITTEDTMFCIPTLYLLSTETKLSISNDKWNGGAIGHTIGGHIYDYLAIGVYPTSVSSDIAYSKSGATYQGSKGRHEFRTYCTSKTVQNGYAMVWNYYQYNLWRILTIFAMKSFNSLSVLGRGGYNGTTCGATMNAMGPFAGKYSDSQSASSGVKAFIENPWGSFETFIDDFISIAWIYPSNYSQYSRYLVFAGQDAVADDRPTTPTGSGSKAKIGDAYLSTFPANSWVYPGGISLDVQKWGFGNNSGGSASTGLCSGYAYGPATNNYQTCGLVGGSYNGPCGVSCMYMVRGVYDSSSKYTARLAFVFDI